MLKNVVLSNLWLEKEMLLVVASTKTNGSSVSNTYFSERLMKWNLSAIMTGERESTQHQHISPLTKSDKHRQLKGLLVYLHRPCPLLSQEAWRDQGRENDYLVEW